MVIILFYRQNASGWIRLFAHIRKKIGQMLYLPCSSFSSFNVSLKMAHLLKSLQKLWAELFSFLVKLLFPRTDCTAGALKGVNVSSKWRTFFDIASLDTYWQVRISCLRKMLIILCEKKLKCALITEMSSTLDGLLIDTEHQSSLFNWSLPSWRWTINSIA